MHEYGVRDVERLLRLPRSTIRALVGAGFVTPGRGPRRAWRFSFQDLIVLRTAQSLAAAKVPRTRITRAMKDLRRHLPESMPLSGLSVAAVGDRVVVREGGRRWQAESGQYLLAFEGDPANGSLSVMESAGAAPGAAQSGAEEWYARGLALEGRDPDSAAHAYRRALAAAPGLEDAHLNLGCLLHEQGRLCEAEKAYRAALAVCTGRAELHFNLGVLLEDMKREREAAEAYESALREDPALADGHYNLSLLYEALGKPQQAIRHMAQYRRLRRRPG